MGLDMYIWEGPKEDRKPREVMYWRKHHVLDRWMHALYIRKGGAKRIFEFNRGDEVELTLADMHALHGDVKNPHDDRDSRFDDPEYVEHQKSEDLWFIRVAKQKLKRGKRLFYES